MDVSKLETRAKKARDAAAREKNLLLANAWRSQEGAADDRAMQRVALAREQLQTQTAAAADQGKNEAAMVRLSFQWIDLRHALQEELSAHPDRYPSLRKQGPPSFRLLEDWLKNEFKVDQYERVCPLPWMNQLDRWIHKGSLTKLIGGRPKLPEPVEQLLKECARMKPRWERYQVREDDGLALIVKWR
ncbi:MAG: hypothetical protein KF760_15690 [Candidatus Eremiobacteraeota bacterium]|nr:hypothetical protein [Candidatus Eremiobacteraeota bacterium]MCW5870566.1 hypothetical protein [Candidatus Eremiobacteraeota bacterium]